MPNSNRRSSDDGRQGGGRGGYAFAGLVFALVWLFLCWPWLSGRVTIPWDAKAHFYPQFAFLARSLAAGESPFWTPNVFDGWPQIADPQSLIFAPLYLAAAFLGPTPPFQLADGVLFATLALGALGVFLYARDRGWRAEGALVAAIAFAFGGSAAWRLQHVGQVMSLAWFPLALFALSRALDRRSIVWGAAAGLFAAFMVAGRDQVAWLQTIILAAFVAQRAFGGAGVRANLRGFVRPLVAGAIVGLVCAGPPVLLSEMLAASCNRPEIVFSEVVKGSLHPASLLTVVAPDLYSVSGPLAYFWGPPSSAWGPTDLFLARNMGEVYFGALALAALIGAGLPLRRADRDMRFFAVVAILLGLYAVGRYTPAFDILFRLPGAGLWRRPADATFPLCALLALIGGYGVHRLAAGEVKWRPIPVALVVLALIAAAVAVAHWKGKLVAAAMPLLFAWVAFALAIALLEWIALRGRARPLLALALIGLFCAVDLRLGNGPNESTALPPGNFDFLRADTTNATILTLREKLAAGAAPDRRDRIELAGLGFDWPNASLSQNFDHDLGYNPLRLALFENFTGAGDTVGLPEQRTFSKAFPSYRSIAADLTGLRYIATGVPIEQIDRTLKPGDLNFVARTADAWIYENPRALPRVFVATQALAADFDAIVRAGGWPDADYRSTVLLSSGSDQTPRRPGTARIAAYGNTHVAVDTDAPDGGWLVLTDIWHPWWQATVDGAPAEIERADVAFRAVRLPPGRHIVEFRFAPFTGLLRQIVTGVAQKSRTP
ncbi:MAG TPA: hypothetical protein PKA55_18540 [Rhodoblastus sp.]|nr:hypothetical protein [Rhodoblastus sp.]